MVQEKRAGRLASVSEEEAPLPSEAAVRHWLQYGRPPGSKVGSAQQVSFTVFRRPSHWTVYTMRCILELHGMELPADKFHSLETAELCSRGVRNSFVLMQEVLANDAGLAAAERAADVGTSERQQERKNLAGFLPEGLRTALGLSVGQPVGSLKPSTDKAHLDAAAITVAPAAVPTMPAGARLELL